MEYLYIDEAPYLQMAEDYSDYDCLYIYQYPYDLMTSYREVTKYHSVTFLQADQLDQLKDLEIREDKKLIVRTVDIGDWRNVMNEVLKAYPQYTRVEKLFTYSPNGITSVLN